MDIFQKVEHARREINQQRNEAQKEKPAREFEQTRRPAQWGERQHIPHDLKKNHVQEEANITKRLTFRCEKKFHRWRFLRRREITVDQVGLEVRKDQPCNNERHKERAIVQERLTEKKVTKTCQNISRNYQVQAKVEDRIKQATGQDRVIRVQRFVLLFEPSVDVPAF